MEDNKQPRRNKPLPKPAVGAAQQAKLRLLRPTVRRRRKSLDVPLAARLLGLLEIVSACRGVSSKAVFHVARIEMVPFPSRPFLDAAISLATFEFLSQVPHIAFVSAFCGEVVRTAESRRFAFSKPSYDTRIFEYEIRLPARMP